MESSTIKIKLIVGLGNPGPEYQNTRHNVGVWFIEKLLASLSSTILFRHENKFHGYAAKCTHDGQTIHLLIPTTYMNNSGMAVVSIASFYKIPPEAIFVAHDEMDLPVGISKIKKGGGHAGHKGIQSIMKSINSPEFLRLRIGIAHPGEPKLVSDYVLNKPSKADKTLIEASIDDSLLVIPDILSGNIHSAMQKLHTK